MKRIAIRFAVSLLTFIVGVAAVTHWYFRHDNRPAPEKPTVSRTVEEVHIAEAIFRYQFGQCCAETEYDVYFLSLGDAGDPGDDLLKRLAGHTPPVKRVSQSLKVTDGVLDKETGKRGLIFGIRRITWLTDTEVDVGTSTYAWGWGQHGYVCRVAREGGRWVVRRCELTSVT